MKVIKNKTIDFATAVQAPVINGNRAARTGYVRLVRLITDEPVPQQTSYTGKMGQPKFPVHLSKLGKELL